MYNSYNQNGNDIDYYTLYLNEGVREARSVFSRYHLAIFFYLLSASVISYGIQIPMMLFLPEDIILSIFENVYFSWLMGVGPMYLIGLPILLIITRNMPTKKREKEKLTFGEFLCTFAVCQAAMTVGSLISNYAVVIVENLTGKVIENNTSNLIQETPLWLIFVVAVVIGPIVEEFIFRKLMIDRLSRFGDTLAIIVSAVSFGFFHGNLSQLFYATALGFILGYIYTKTGNVWYTTALHMLVNFVGSFVSILFLDVIEALYTMLDELSYGIEIDIVEFIQSYMIVSSYAVVQYAVALAGIVVFCVTLAKRKVIIDKNAEVALSGKRAFEAAYINVGMILFLLFCLSSIVLDVVI